MYSEKAKKFCEIFTLLLSYVVPVKSKVKILQNFVASSEYMNFTVLIYILWVKHKLKNMTHTMHFKSVQVLLEKWTLSLKGQNTVAFGPKFVEKFGKKRLVFWWVGVTNEI